MVLSKLECLPRLNDVFLVSLNPIIVEVLAGDGEGTVRLPEDKVIEDRLALFHVVEIDILARFRDLTSLGNEQRLVFQPIVDLLSQVLLRFFSLQA